MPDQVVKVFTKQISDGQISMWGTLHLNTRGGGLAGWLCDSWTVAGTSWPQVLRPRLHWLSKEDDRFHLVSLNMPAVGRSSMEIGPVDTEIDARREAFMRATLAEWENEYFTTQGINLS